MKRRIVGYSLWAIVMGVLFMVPGMLVLAVVPLAILGVGLLLDPPWGIHLERTLSTGHVQLGEKVEVSVRVRVSRGIGLLILRERPHPGLVPGGKTLWVLFKGIKPLETTVRYRLRAEAWGRLEIPRTEVLSFNPLGIRSSWGVYGDKSGLSVDLPANISIIHGKGFKRRGLPGGSAALRGAVSMDFREVRHYQPGDSVKVINWKATARTGQLMANEYERESRGTVLLMVDASPDTEPGRPGEIYSRAVELAALLAGHLLENEYHVGLYVLGRRRLILPSSGSKHLRIILHEMTAQGGRPSRWEGLDEAVKDIAGQIVHYSPTIVLITEVNSLKENSLKRGAYTLRSMYRSRPPLLIVDIVKSREKDINTLKRLETQAIRKALIGQGAKLMVWKTGTVSTGVIASRVLEMVS